MSDYLAHSKRDGHRRQTYEEHVYGVMRRAKEYADILSRYGFGAAKVMQSVVTHAAELHDLGKLDPENQAVLQQPDNRRHLPVNHVDAGTAHLIDENDHFAALTVIENNVVTAVIGSEYAERIANGKITWQELQKYSIAIPKGKVEKWNLAQIKGDIYAWVRDYDGFLGYMAGVLLDP